MQSKLDFLRNDLISLISNIPNDKTPAFGKMNLQQMIEHMSWSFQIASGKLHFKNNQSPELTEKMHRFMMSEKPFRDNTPNSNIGEDLLPVKTKNVSQAIDNLRLEIDDFIQRFENEDGLRVENPFFGMLNFEEQIQLLHKHAMHHLRQFDSMP